MAIAIEKVIIAGEPSPAVGLLGASLAQAGVNKLLHATLIPLYGPVILSANETSFVILSSQEVASPVVGVPDALIVLTQATFERFHARVKAGGLLIYDSSTFELDPRDVRDDLRGLAIPAAQLAEGPPRLPDRPERAALPILGAYAARSRLLDLTSIVKAAQAVLDKDGWAAPEVEAAMQGIRRGADYVRQRKYMPGRYRYSIFEG